MTQLDSMSEQIKNMFSTLQTLNQDIHSEWKTVQTQQQTNQTERMNLVKDLEARMSSQQSMTQQEREKLHSLIVNLEVGF